MTQSSAKQIPEASYPVTFRQREAQDIMHILGQHKSVTIVGMKRVGVSNFLRFIAYNKQAINAKLQTKHFVFIYVDANDLTEIDSFQFWLLLLKRLFDTISQLPQPQRDQVNAIYEQVTSRSGNEMFFLLEAIKEIAAAYAASNFYPIIILARFDRLLPIFSEQFFANLQSIIDIAREHIAYIFTSYLPLTALCPQIFFAASFSMFTKTYYLKPGKASDVDPIIQAFENQHAITLPNTVTENLLKLSGGHVQLLQLCLIALSEQHTSAKTDLSTLLLTLSSDERIILQCDEIFDSLSQEDQQYLLSGNTMVKFGPPYLIETGIISKVDRSVFSPIFEQHLITKRNEKAIPTFSLNQLTRKETALLNYMVNHKNDICSRDDLIGAIWPEYEDISDWALDQLVSRLRRKLELFNSAYKIKTNRGKGYELVEP